MIKVLSSRPLSRNVGTAWPKLSSVRMTKSARAWRTLVPCHRGLGTTGPCSEFRGT